MLVQAEACKFGGSSGYRKLLQEREFGKRGSLKFIDFVQARNLQSLELSTSVEVQTHSRSPTNCLAIERIEYRYLLSGALNGCISLFDLETASGGQGGKHSLQPLLHHTSGTNTSNGNFAGASGMVATVQWYPEDSGAFIAAGMTGHVSIFDTNYFAIVADFALDQVLYCARMRSNVGESTLIAAALQDGTVRLCDPRTRDTSHIIKAHDRAATCVDWSAAVGSEYLLATAGMDGAVRFWDVRRAGSMSDAVVRCLDWRGDFTASATIDTRKLYTSLTDQRSPAANSTGVQIRDATQHYRFNPSESEARGSSMRAGRAHDGGVMSLCYTSCGNFVITSGNDQRLRLWHAYTGKLMSVTYPDNVVPVAQLPYDVSVAEMSFASGDALLVPASGNCSVPSTCLSPVGGGAEGEVRTNEGDILIIPAHSEDGQPTRLLRGHLQRVTALAYRKPQQQVVSAARDGLIFLWTPAGPKGSASVTKDNRNGVEERERNRQHRLFYGSSGARYDYTQVLQNVGHANDNGSSSAAGSSSSSKNLAASGRSLLRGPVLLPKSLPGDENIADQDPSIHDAENTFSENNVVLPTEQTAIPRNTWSSDEGSESGDDWSDEEIPLSLPAAHGATLQRGGTAAVKRARTSTSAASIVSAAGAAMRDASSSDTRQVVRTPSLPALSSASTLTAVANHSSSSSSRSFVPPIIQQYMADANRTARSSNQAPRTSIGDIAAGGAAIATPAPDWDNIDRIFEATPASAPSAAGSASSTVPSVSPARSAGAIATAAKSNTLTADQRYAQWLKQSRSKAAAAKKK